ncbi:DUF2202 domain-containing protein [Candidatus Dojkabacteria bacterium]|uniref:DUF2202 domain-containing protein n=1 Tax=Candidatus Dojkabacteria bacterium TaxID=2099670 RepID=A0A955L1Y9_9BACT|nr:DUF2202 domain-containing protein [Candidatus Dojkabacteria bacterium]
MNKKNVLLVTFTLTIITVLVLLVSFKNNSQNEFIDNYSQIDDKDYLNDDTYYSELPVEDLSQDEINGLLQMREEEKLAHDVYTKLYEMWGQKIFSNISDSEQTHTDLVATLLDKYNVEDPVKTAEIGVFTNDEISKLYNELIELGQDSLMDALKVGATVEDLDIYDLANLMEKTDNEDILAAYQNLTKGSRNHLRSFTRLINRNGGIYSPQYISTDLYNEIITSPSENGVLYDSSGNQR